MAAKVNQDECLGCEACVGTCPASAISMADGKAVVNPDECLDCGACVDACPASAIKMD